MISARLTDADRKQMNEFAYILLEQSIPDIRTAKRRVFYTALAKIMGGRPGTAANLLSEDRPLTNQKFSAFKEAFQKCHSINKSFQTLFEAWCIRIEDKLVEISDDQTEDLDNDFTTTKIDKEKSNENTSLMKSRDNEHDRQFSKSQFRETFLDTYWYCYSRSENRGNPQIGRHVIWFKKFDAYNTCEIELTHYEHERGKWQGTANFYPYDLVVLNVYQRDSNNQVIEPAHFYLKAHNSLEKLKLFYGQVVFRHMDLDTIISKTVILSREKTSDDIKSGKFKFNDLDLHTDKRFRESLNQYFSKREQNRLSSPVNGSVFNFDLFKAWIGNNRPKQTDIYKQIAGTYDLHYKLHSYDEDFVTDQLTLTVNDTGEVHAVFFHTTADDKEEDADAPPTRWAGREYPNFSSHVLSIHLKGPLNIEADFSNRYIQDTMPNYLLIDLPGQTTKVINTLTGVIAGWRDGEKGTVARLFVMIKFKQNQEGDVKKIDPEFYQEIENNKFYPKSYEEEQLRQYFNCYKSRSWVRPPSTTTISKFQHLKQACFKSAPRIPDEDRPYCLPDDEKPPVQQE